MDMMKILKEAKKQEESGIEEILNFYNNFIYYEMNKYHIQDKYSCYDEVKANILKAIFLFKI